MSQQSEISKSQTLEREGMCCIFNMGGPADLRSANPKLWREKVCVASLIWVAPLILFLFSHGSEAHWLGSQTVTGAGLIIRWNIAPLYRALSVNCFAKYPDLKMDYVLKHKLSKLLTVSDKCLNLSVNCKGAPPLPYLTFLPISSRYDPSPCPLINLFKYF